MKRMEINFSQRLHINIYAIYLCVDSRSWPADLPGYRRWPPFRGVLQATSSGAAAGGDDTQTGLGSHVSDASTNRRKTWSSKQRGLSSPYSEIRPSVTRDISDSTDQMQKTLVGIVHPSMTFTEIDLASTIPIGQKNMTSHNQCWNNEWL